jgi:hypothetical protein
MTTTFNKLCDLYGKYYSHTEYLAVDEIIMIFKSRVIFNLHILKNYKGFGIKIYQLCDSQGYVYNVTAYLDKDKKRVTPSITATHATITGLTATQNVGHKLYVDNFFSSPA